MKSDYDFCSCGNIKTDRANHCMACSRKIVKDKSLYSKIKKRNGVDIYLYPVKCLSCGKVESKSHSKFIRKNPHYCNACLKTGIRNHAICLLVDSNDFTKKMIAEMFNLGAVRVGDIYKSWRNKK